MDEKELKELDLVIAKINEEGIGDFIYKFTVVEYTPDTVHTSGNWIDKATGIFKKKPRWIKSNTEVKRRADSLAEAYGSLDYHTRSKLPDARAFRHTDIERWNNDSNSWECTGFPSKRSLDEVNNGS